MPSLDLAALVGDCADVVMLLDIDGTLAPLVEDPAAAAVPADVLDDLRWFADRCALLGFVTGRSLDHARKMVPLDGVLHAAAHGTHLRWPDGSEDVCDVAQAARPQLELAATLARTVGWRHEDKGHAVTFHARHLASPEGALVQMRQQAVTVLDPTAVEVVDAHTALEVRPVGARTKGDAVLAAVARVRATPPHDSQPISLLLAGDDLTDADAFNAVAQPPDGVGVVVRIAVGRSTVPERLAQLADHIVEGPGDLADALHMLRTDASG